MLRTLCSLGLKIFTTFLHVFMSVVKVFLRLELWVNVPVAVFFSYGGLVPVQRYDHIAKSHLRKSLVKDAKILRLSWKYSKTNSAKLWENRSTSFCVCLVSGKQRNLEIRANIQIAFKMFGQRVASLVNVLSVNQKNFCWARKGLGTSLALQCHAGLVDCGCRVRNDNRRQR